MTKRILIIDDDRDFCLMIQRIFSSGVLGFRADYTDNETDMLAMLRKAEAEGDPYEIATIDMEFESRGSTTPFRLGHHFLATLKQDFPYILCILVSGATFSPSSILMMRDTQGLDFFIDKNDLDPIPIKGYLQHVLEYRSNQTAQAPKPVSDTAASSSDPQIFISYRRLNTWGKARAIANSLKEQGCKVFLDVDSIGSGPFPKHILEAIVACDYFIPLLATASLDSEWVQKELRYAIELEKTIIPILLDDFDLNEAEIPAEFDILHRLNNIPITPQTYEGQINRLVNQFLNLT